MVMTTLHDNFFGGFRFSSNAELLDSLKGDRFKTNLVCAINELPERARILMGMIYEQEMNLCEICAVLDVCESHVSKLHSEALTQLNSSMMNG